MKKLLCFLCITTLLLSILAGCGNPVSIPSVDESDFATPPAVGGGEPGEKNTPTPPADSDNGAAEEDWWEIYNLSSLLPDDIEPDLTQTGELVLYLPTWPEPWYYKPFVEMYNIKYPNVEFKVEGFGGDYTAFSTSLSTELMAGTGPDILFPGIMYHSDIQKLAASGVFMDLNEFIASDDSFDIDEFIKPVMDSGILNGKRYLMPYGYYISGLVYYPRKLDEIGFDTSKISDPISFIEEIVRTLPKAQEMKRFEYVYNSWSLLSDLLDSSGIKIVDIETKEILPDEEYFERFIKAYKPFFPFDSTYYDHITDTAAEKIAGGVTLFTPFRTLLDFIYVAGLQKKNSNYQIRAVQSINKENLITLALTVAIREGSPNKQNAWNFVKFLLSEENQGRYSFYDIPVREKYILPKVLAYHEQRLEAVHSQIAPLSNEEIDAFLQIATNVATNKNHSSGFYLEFIRSHLEAYFKDEISYDEAVSRIKSDLRLYLSE